MVNNSKIVFNLKSEQLEYLNKHQVNQIDYVLVTIKDLSEKYLKDLFVKWNSTYELDGIIIEVNNLQLQNKLGRETSTNNPCYARAYKGNFEEQKSTTQTGVTWAVSKQGLLKPVIQVEPVRLDGVNVTNITANNAKFYVDMKLGIGAIVTLKRSGMVIPLIVKVVKPVNEIVLPTCCPSCKSTNIGWNDNHIELICLNSDCSGQQLGKIISFFNILGIDNVGEGVCNQLYDAGYNTIHKILSLKQSDLENLERFGKRKAEIVYESIHSKLHNVPLAKLQHAVGIFNNLGSKKLALVEHFQHKPTITELIAIDGFSDISAKAYLEGYDKFNDFIKNLPITIMKTEKIESFSNELNGASFCFTGVRLKDCEEKIEKMGGKIASGVSKTLTYLVMKEKGSGSSKESKALDLGVKILTVDELEKMLK
jgi:DNA ligase (NAD+)